METKEHSFVTTISVNKNDFCRTLGNTFFSFRGSYTMGFETLFYTMTAF